MFLRDRIAVVTGGGSGLGAASARHLAREGAVVALIGRSEDELRENHTFIRSMGGDARSYVADISDPDAIQRTMDAIGSEFGHIDIVFANAGINGVWAPIEQLGAEDWQETINVNLNGTFYTLKFAVPYMKARGGSIIITSSVNGTRTFSNTGATAYSCTKAAQVAMAKMLALELAKHKIRVNVICPGAIESNIDENTEKRNVEQAKEPVEFPEGQIPLTDGAPGKAEDVADLVFFLASDMSKHISGTEIWIDGAQSLLVG
jgi:NAD(P)-dependent dehydrogenase (short-subunit alcohol dehydrogenase family)